MYDCLRNVKGCEMKCYVGGIETWILMPKNQLILLLYKQ